MLIEQRDIAHLSDDQLRLMVLAVMHTVDDTSTADAGLPQFWRGFAVALMRARKQRAATFAELAMGATDDDDCGELVEPGSDPVADAQAELRRAVRDDAWPTDPPDDAA